MQCGGVVCTVVGLFVARVTVGCSRINTCSLSMLLTHLSVYAIAFNGTSLFLWSIDLASAGASATGNGPVLLAVSRAAAAAKRMTLGWLEAHASRRVAATKGACSITAITVPQ